MFSEENILSLFSYKFESLFTLLLKESFLKLPYVAVFISTSNKLSQT